MDIVGKMSNYVYEMSPECEGTMLFFPAELIHQVYPFFECDEERITIAGNILIDTSRKA